MKTFSIIITAFLFPLGLYAQKTEHLPNFVTVVYGFNIEDNLSLEIDPSHPGTLPEKVAPGEVRPCKVSFSKREDLYLMNEEGKYYLCTKISDGTFQKISMPDEIMFWLGYRCPETPCIAKL